MNCLPMDCSATAKSEARNGRADSDVYVVGFGSNYFHIFGEDPIKISLSNNDNNNNDDSDNINPSPVYSSNSCYNPMSLPKILPKELISSSVKKNSNGDSEESSAIRSAVLKNGSSHIKQIAVGKTNLVVLSKEEYDRKNVYQVGTINGYPYKTPIMTPLQIPVQCSQISTGRRHVLALFEGGNVCMSWGNNHFNQCGLGEYLEFYAQPRIIERLMYVGGKISHITAGPYHNAVVVTEASSSQTQRIFTWGYNSKNQCGIKEGKSNTVSVPTPVHDFPPSVIKNTEKQQQITGIKISSQKQKIQKLSLGISHSVALTTDGHVYCWGHTSSGRCGFSPNKRGVPRSQYEVTLPVRVKVGQMTISANTDDDSSSSYKKLIDIAAGDKHTLALADNGKVFSWGCGENGELGHGVSVVGLSGPRVIEELDFLHKYTQEQKINENDKTLIPRVVSIYASGSYSAALTNTHDLYTWGYGDPGQLGHLPEEINSEQHGGEQQEQQNLDHITNPISRRLINNCRICDSQIFDSKYNVLFPKRVKFIRDKLDMDVIDASLGPNNLVLSCKKR